MDFGICILSHENLYFIPMRNGKSLECSKEIIFSGCSMENVAEEQEPTQEISLESFLVTSTGKIHCSDLMEYATPPVVEVGKGINIRCVL